MNINNEFLRNYDISLIAGKIFDRIDINTTINLNNINDIIKILNDIKLCLVSYKNYNQ